MQAPFFAMASQAPNRTTMPHRERGSGILIGFFMRRSFRTFFGSLVLKRFNWIECYISSKALSTTIYYFFLIKLEITYFFSLNIF